MFKVDLHTHSVASPDGGLGMLDYQEKLKSGGLDYIAVTDHNTVEFALQLHDRLGERIIVGEEISTTEGEIIGLYLHTTVPKLLTPRETVAAIRAQGGLVYIPHPFETVRSGITPEALNSIADDVDVIEIHNGRAVFQNKSAQARTWKEQYGWVGAASSDAHAAVGWGKTFTTISEPPTRHSIIKLLNDASYQANFPGVKAILYPKFNRLRKMLQ